MHIDLMRDPSTNFPSLENPSRVRSLRIWHCKYKTLRPVIELRNLEELVIGSFPHKSLDLLVSLVGLRYLRILHLPKISEISALAALVNVESLSLATSPGWDAAGKRTIVESLAPIVSISALRHLELFGVCPADKSVAALEQCKGLKSARFSQYPKQEVDRFYKATGVSDDFNPAPSFPESVVRTTTGPGRRVH